jgi:hypothetical protein
MSWVHDRLNNEERARKEAAKIRLHADSLYGELWREIAARVEDAKSKLVVSTNGSEYRRVVLRGGAVTGAYHQPDKLIISLADDKQTLLIQFVDEYESDPVTVREIPLGVCDGDIVCLMHDGRQLSIPEAAKLILEPFLFPPAK